MDARTTFYSGAGATLASLAAIAILSRREGHAAVRPVNTTSHVIWGPEDAPRERVDARHTLPGLAINVSSAFFWAAVFASGTPARARSTRGLIGRAFLTSTAAAVMDYGLVPRRLRPGWELALRPRSVAIALAAMGAGLAVGGIAARSLAAPAYRGEAE